MVFFGFIQFLHCVRIHVNQRNQEYGQYDLLTIPNTQHFFPPENNNAAEQHVAVKVLGFFA